MADLVWSEVVDLDAALSVVDAQAQALILSYVNGSVDPAVLGGETGGAYLLARATLAAHLGRLGLPGEVAAPGAVASKSIGGMSKSYFQYAGGDPSMLARTTWGQTFLSIVRNSGARAGLLI